MPAPAPAAPAAPAPAAPARAIRLLVVAVVLLAAGGCLRNPEAEARMAQQMIEIGDALNDLRVNVEAMAHTLDSLRIVAARQDTTLQRLANVTGVVVVK